MKLASWEHAEGPRGRRSPRDDRHPADHDRSTVGVEEPRDDGEQRDPGKGARAAVALLEAADLGGSGHGSRLRKRSATSTDSQREAVARLGQLAVTGLGSATAGSGSRSWRFSPWAREVLRAR